MKSSLGAYQTLYRTLPVTFVTSRLSGMRPYPTKCRELIINFIQFQPAPVSELQLMGSAIKRVASYKILEIHVSDDLPWNTHMYRLLVQVGNQVPICGGHSSEICRAGR